MTPDAGDTLPMSHEAAVRWCENFKMRYYRYRTPQVSSYGLPGLPAGPGGEEFFDVSGWRHFVPPRPDVRIHAIGHTLVEAVTRAQAKWDAAEKGSER